MTPESAIRSAAGVGLLAWRVVESAEASGDIEGHRGLVVFVLENLALNRQVRVCPEVCSHCDSVGDHVGGGIFSFLAFCGSPPCRRELPDVVESACGSFVFTDGYVEPPSRILTPCGPCLFVVEDGSVGPPVRWTAGSIALKAAGISQ
jgi:hypothetical protein